MATDALVCAIARHKPTDRYLSPGQVLHVDAKDFTAQEEEGTECLVLQCLAETYRRTARWVRQSRTRSDSIRGWQLLSFGGAGEEAPHPGLRQILEAAFTGHCRILLSLPYVTALVADRMTHGKALGPKEGRFGAARDRTNLETGAGPLAAVLGPLLVAHTVGARKFRGGLVLTAWGLNGGVAAHGKGLDRDSIGFATEA